MSARSMRRRVRRFAALAAVALAATLPLACGDEETAEDGGGGSGADACDDLATALCAKFASCFSGLVALSYGDEATCKTRVAADCTQQVAAEGSGYTPEFLDACAAALDSSTCDTVYKALLDECAIPPGGLAPGTPCANPSQCASTYCRGEQLGCGVCTNRIPAGGDCSGDRAACAAGTACGFNNQCLVLGETGDACDADTPCAPLLSCVDGTCGPGAGPGQACDPDVAPCDAKQQLFCDGTGVCAKFEIAGPGEPCGIVDGVAVACSAGGECVGGDGSATCAAAGADGEACGGAEHDKCLGPADCVDGTCKFPDAASCG